MTVAQNVAFPLRQHTPQDARGDPTRSCSARLAEVGLPENVLGKKPAELSGGMRKRVGLARALALEPEMMLYDEPTTGLDPIMSDVINELIISTRQQHPVTSVIVTHDMRTAQKVADRVVMLYPLGGWSGTSRRSSTTARRSRSNAAADRRVTQFVRGEAGERLMEMRQQREDKNMDERVMQFRVGVMVLATLSFWGILIAMFGEMPKMIYGEYTLYITFIRRRE